MRLTTKRFCYLAFLLCFFLLLTSCRKPAVEKPEPVWQKVAMNDDERIILNLATDENYLYCLGAMVNSRIDKSGALSGVFTISNTWDRMPANGKYNIEFSQNKKLLYISSNTDFQDSYGTQLPVSAIDSSLDVYNTGSQTPRPIIAINDEAQVLLSARDKNQQYHLYLVSFKVRTDGGFLHAPSSIVKVAMPPDVDILVSIQTHGGEFFVTTALKFYKIDKSGRVAATFDTPSGGEMFSFNNKLYVVDGSLWESADNGTTFPSAIRHDASLNGYYFRELNGKIMVFVPYSGVGLFAFTPTGFTIKAVRNKGLEGAHITAITSFNDKLYVATLTGLYYLNWKDVLY